MSEILTLIESINANVPAIVTTPVNSCENPIKSPSENCSTSVMILLIVSPYGWLSTYFKGSFCRCSNAFIRTSFTTRYVIWLLHRFISHCATLVTPMITASFTSICRIFPKSTCPFPTIKSTASPIKIGAYKVKPTVITAKTNDNIR